MVCLTQSGCELLSLPGEIIRRHVWSGRPGAGGGINHAHASAVDVFLNMYKIIHKQVIAQDIKKIDIAAPAIAARACRASL